MGASGSDLRMPMNCLGDYAAFMSWLHQARQSATPGELLAANADLTSPLGLLRRAMMAMRERPVPRREVRTWLAAAHEQARPDEQLLIEIYEQYAAVKRAHMEGQRETDLLRQSLREYEHLLMQVRRMPDSPLQAEMELLTSDGLIRSAKRLQRSDLVEEHAPRFEALAASLGSAPLFQHSMIQLLGAYTFLGDYVRAIDLGRDRRLTTLARQGIYTELLLSTVSNNYFNLGNLDQALAVLDDPYHGQPRPALIQSTFDSYRVYFGELTVDPSAFELPRYDTFFKCLLNFTVAESLVPVGKALAQREELLREVLTTSELALTRDTYPTDLLFGYWLRARARLLLGEYGMAVQELATLFEPQPQELLNRALLTALDLELAMTPMSALRIPLSEAEQRFRQVFEDARTTRYANPESLARLVQRWHPQAAAYAALMPNPVRECLPALDLLARVDQRATWRGQALPPALVPHLTRLGVRGPTLGVTLSGNAAYQVARLSRQVGEATVWGPVLPMLPVVVALSRGGEAHRDAARRAWRDFGMLPGAHRDPELEGVVEVWRAVVAGDRPLADGLRALQDL